MGKKFINLPDLGFVVNIDNIGDINTKQKSLKLKDRQTSYPLNESDYRILMDAIKSDLLNPGD